jgi:response regulator RpfG family c-di-GMP phosphodiesterase
MTTASIPSSKADAALDKATVLLLDDEPAVVSGLYRLLHGRCITHTATDPKEALAKAAELPDLAVVVSDMRMPGMDGAAFLSEMRKLRPDVVRILLTGYADVDAAVAAINDGRVFRFLWKPCSSEDLHACLRDAVAQHRLITAEKELLEQTLHGSVRALQETLSLANPLAFSRAERIKQRVASILPHLQVEQTWDIEVAAMLSQLGAVTLPPAVTESLHMGDELAPVVQQLVDKVPATSVDLLGDVPRLEEVRRSILFQNQRYDGRGPVSDDVRGSEIPLGARVLHAAADYDTLEARGLRAREAMEQLEGRTGVYDPTVLAALRAAVTVDGEGHAVDKLPLADLRPGMVLAADVTTADGVMLCGRGQEINERLLERLENWAQKQPIAEPIQVLHGVRGPLS